MKFSKPILVLAAFWAVFAVAAAPRAALAGENWLRVRSKNFELVGSADEKGLRAVATRLEQFRLVFTQLFPAMNLDSPVPTRVVVFRDKATFDRFKPIDWAAGYFLSAEGINYIVLAAEGDERVTFPTIFHEYTHFLVNNSIGRANAPPWFNEGLAEYYERFSIEGDRNVRLGALNQEHLLLLRRSPLIPFETFFATDYYTLHKQSHESAKLFYAQSWILIHYLLHGAGGALRPRFGRFVELLGRGVKPAEAFAEAFQTDYAAVEAELGKYIAQRSFAETLVPFRERLVFDGQLQVSPVADADAKSFQGDLLYQNKRYDEAEKILREALALDDRSAFANMTLGLVKMRQKKFSEARGWLEKATLADSRNYLAFFNYAYAVSREGTTEFGFASSYSLADTLKIRENLRKAIELNPNFAESYNLLAFINVVRNEEIDESIALINRALAIAPGNQWYQIRLAELYMRREDFASARALALKINQTAADDELRIYAENSLRTINSLEAQLEAAKHYKKLPDREEVTDEPMSDAEIARRRAKAMLESLNETLRKPRPSEVRLLGFVTKIDCQPAQILFSVRADGRQLQLKSDSLETLTLISFDAGSVNAQFGCGVIAGERLSVITYRPDPSEKSKVTGEIVAVEFVPPTFRFLDRKQ